MRKLLVIIVLAALLLTAFQGQQTALPSGEGAQPPETLLTSDEGTQQQTVTTESESGPASEKLRFETPMAFFELEDSTGRKTVCREGRFLADQALEVTDVFYQMGAMGYITDADAAFIEFKVPCSEQYTFRVEEPGLIVKETRSAAAPEFYGQGLRTAVWRENALELQGDSGEYSVELYRTTEAGEKLRITLSFSMEEKTFIDWTQTAVTVRGASQTLSVCLFRGKDRMKSQTATLPIQGDFTVSTEALEEDVLTYTDESGTQTVSLTWKPLD